MGHFAAAIGLLEEAVSLTRDPWSFMDVVEELLSKVLSRKESRKESLGYLKRLQAGQ